MGIPVLVLFQDWKVCGTDIYRTDICGEIRLIVNNNMRIKVEKNINNV